MLTEEQENLLDICIDTAADYEKRTGMKTAAIYDISQRELAEKTGLTLKEVKKWYAAAKSAQNIIKPQ